VSAAAHARTTFALEAGALSPIGRRALAPAPRDQAAAAPRPRPRAGASIVVWIGASPPRSGAKLALPRLARQVRGVLDVFRRWLARSSRRRLECVWAGWSDCVSLPAALALLADASRELLGGLGPRYSASVSLDLARVDADCIAPIQAIVGAAPITSWCRPFASTARERAVWARWVTGLRRAQAGRLTCVAIPLLDRSLLGRAHDLYHLVSNLGVDAIGLEPPAGGPVAPAPPRAPMTGREATAFLRELLAVWLDDAQRQRIEPLASWYRDDGRERSGRRAPASPVRVALDATAGADGPGRLRDALRLFEGPRAPRAGRAAPSRDGWATIPHGRLDLTDPAGAAPRDAEEPV
jgi:hypothetical protein